MILDYSIVVEATDDPKFWGYYSVDLAGYTGVATSLNQAIAQAIEGIPDYLDFIRETGGTVPRPNPSATISFSAVKGKRKSSQPALRKKVRTTRKKVSVVRAARSS